MRSFASTRSLRKRRKKKKDKSQMINITHMCDINISNSKQFPVRMRARASRLLGTPRMTCIALKRE